MAYTLAMIEIIQSEIFSTWIAGLRDRQAVQRINTRIRRLSVGNTGDAKPVRDGISELRIDHGPRYRVYFVRRGQVTIVLLAGGDKRTQDADIERANKIAKEWRN